MRTILIALAVVITGATAVLDTAAARCGTERWAVKTLTDPGSLDVDLVRIYPATVEQFRALPAPAYNDANPRAKPERIVYRVTAKLIGWKLEADQDFHVVIVGTNPTDTMIVEFPSPACVKGSRAAVQIAAARAAFVKRFGAPTPSG